jgi:hypothetical protein
MNLNVHVRPVTITGKATRGLDLLERLQELGELGVLGVDVIAARAQPPRRVGGVVVSRIEFFGQPRRLDLINEEKEAKRE